MSYCHGNDIKNYKCLNYIEESWKWHKNDIKNYKCLDHIEVSWNFTSLGGLDFAILDCHPSDIRMTSKYF